jgi:hypothetical protein
MAAMRSLSIAGLAWLTREAGTKREQIPGFSQPELAVFVLRPVCFA